MKTGESEKNERGGVAFTVGAAIRFLAELPDHDAGIELTRRADG